MNAETFATVITAWVAVLTLVGGTVSFIFRHWFKSYAEKVNKALKAAEDNLKEAKEDIAKLQVKYTTIKAYASSLRDGMLAAGLKPEKPPIDFFD